MKVFTVASAFAVSTVRVPGLLAEHNVEARTKTEDDGLIPRVPSSRIKNTDTRMIRPAPSASNHLKGNYRNGPSVLPDLITKMGHGNGTKKKERSMKKQHRRRAPRSSKRNRPLGNAQPPRYVDLRQTTIECEPQLSDADAGILQCDLGEATTYFCRYHSGSSLGGVCVGIAEPHPRPPFLRRLQAGSAMGEEDDVYDYDYDYDYPYDMYCGESEYASVCDCSDYNIVTNEGTILCEINQCNCGSGEADNRCYTWERQMDITYEEYRLRSCYSYPDQDWTACGSSIVEYSYEGDVTLQSNECAFQVQGNEFCCTDDGIIPDDKCSFRNCPGSTLSREVCDYIGDLGEECVDETPTPSTAANELPTLLNITTQPTTFPSMRPTIADDATDAPISATLIPIMMPTRTPTETDINNAASPFPTVSLIGATETPSENPAIEESIPTPANELPTLLNITTQPTTFPSTIPTTADDATDAPSSATLIPTMMPTRTPTESMQPTLNNNPTTLFDVGNSTEAPTPVPSQNITDIREWPSAFPTRLTDHSTILIHLVNQEEGGCSNGTDDIALEDVGVCGNMESFESGTWYTFTGNGNSLRFLPSCDIVSDMKNVLVSLMVGSCGNFTCFEQDHVFDLDPVLCGAIDEVDRQVRKLQPRENVSSTADENDLFDLQTEMDESYYVFLHGFTEDSVGSLLPFPLDVLDIGNAAFPPPTASPIGATETPSENPTIEESIPPSPVPPSSKPTKVLEEEAIGATAQIPSTIAENTAPLSDGSSSGARFGIHFVCSGLVGFFTGRLLVLVV